MLIALIQLVADYLLNMISSSFLILNAQSLLQGINENSYIASQGEVSSCFVHRTFCLLINVCMDEVNLLDVDFPAVYHNYFF